MNKKNQLKKILKANSFFKEKLNKFPLNRNEQFIALCCILVLISLPVFVKFYSYHKFYKQNHQISKSSNDTITSIVESLDELNKQTPLDLKYTKDVEKYINLYLEEQRGDLEIMLGRSELYFPIIEEYLDKYNLPLEIKYLAVLESSLNPLAKSKSGAVGLWQFLYNSCPMVDLKVNSYIDERRDIYKSTEAACKYLEYLYRIFDNWELALTAYNGGPGGINKAILKSGGEKDYWKIRAYLTNEAAEYIPKFIAFNYLFNNAGKYNIEAQKPVFSYTDIDTIHMQKPVKMTEISVKYNISVEQLEFLNPIYKTEYIPFDSNSLYYLIMPKKTILNYEKKTHAQKNVNYLSENGNTYITLAKPEKWKCIRYIVEKGDFYHKIALKYNCTIDDLNNWNKINNKQLAPGQILKIWIHEE